MRSLQRTTQSKRLAGRIGCRIDGRIGCRIEGRKGKDAWREQHQADRPASVWNDGIEIRRVQQLLTAALALLTTTRRRTDRDRRERLVLPRVPRGRPAEG